MDIRNGSCLSRSMDYLLLPHPSIFKSIPDCIDTKYSFHLNRFIDTPNKMMNIQYNRAASFGLAHGINDFLAGYLLAFLSTHHLDNKLVFFTFLTYSVIAFAGQLPVGILLDKFQRIRGFSLLGILAMILAVLIAPFHLFTAIVFSGLASALIHVCGGTVCYLSSQNNATLMGMFASPGVVGLVLGGVLGALTQSVYATWWIWIPLLLLLLWMLRLQFPSYKLIKTEHPQAGQLILEQHDFFMIVLLAAIAFRSLLWNIVHLMSLEDHFWLLGLGISAGIGKLVGGYLSFKFNWKNYILFSMLAAVLFLNIDRGNFWLFCIGVALLQSALPVTVLLMQNFFRTQPATAAGLSLGVAVILAGIPTYLEAVREIPNDTFLFLIVCALFLMFNGWIVWMGMRQQKKPKI